MNLQRSSKVPPALVALALTAVTAVLLTAALAVRGGASYTFRPKGTDLEHRITSYTARFRAGTGYRPPRRADREAVAKAVGLVLDGHPQQARTRLAAVNFDLRTLTDNATGRQYVEVADRTASGPRPRGWGRVYIDLSAPARWSVQVPHPVADARTEQLGVAVLRSTPGGVLVLAGAHRRAGAGDSADVAHSRNTVFAAVCAELARRHLPGLQVHGFADKSAPRYNVIVSAGSAARPDRTDANALTSNLRKRGFAVCRAWLRSCPLEGKTNVEASEAAKRGSRFLHVEFAHTVRTHPRALARAVKALATVTTGWSKPRNRA